MVLPHHSTYSTPMGIQPTARNPDRRPTWRRSVALALLTTGLALWLAATANPRSAVILHWDGAIGPATADYVTRALREAQTTGAALLVLRLDTPGGLDASMRDIIRAIVDSPIPVVTYVSPGGARAASAGTYILYASHVAAMSPGTNLGAATPVAIGGLPQPGGTDDGEGKEKKPARTARDAAPTSDSDEAAAESEPAPGATREPAKRTSGSALERKAVNDAVAYIRALAELRGRNADWAEEAVREAASLSAQAALEAGVVDLIAPDLEALLAALDGRKVETATGEITLVTAGLELVHVTPDWRTELLAAITNPNVALILMLIGVYGLIFEFMNPGAIYPGTIGSICLLLGLYALAALPVNYAGLGLMLLGLALMVAEAFMPAFGVLGIGGTVAFVLGATLLIDSEAPGFELSWPVIAGVATASLVLTLVILRLAIRASRHHVESGASAMVGLPATVLDWSGTRGHVLAHGERWAAVGAATLTPGTAVEVTAIEGLTLTVAPRAQPGGTDHAR